LVKAAAGIKTGAEDHCFPAMMTMLLSRFYQGMDVLAIGHCQEGYFA
jgi:hypothetical protein